MAIIYQPIDLLAESTAVQREADKAIHLKNELQSILVEESDVQAKSLHWLKNHAQMVHQWICKIENNIQSLDDEIVHQIGKKNCWRKATNALKIAANVNAESSGCRSTKLDGDYRDDVAKEIEKEKILIDCSNSQLASSILEVEEYIERMKAAKEDLESFRSFKYENYGIECDNVNLKQSSKIHWAMFTSENTDEGNKWDNGAVKKFRLTQRLEKLECKEPSGSKFQHREVTRTEWENNIQLHTKLAEKLLTDESRFKINEKIVSSKQRALWEQAQTIDVSLMKKRMDVQEYIHALHTQLTLTIQKQNEVDKTVQNTEDTIKKLRQSLKLSQTRLNSRSQKPISEIFFDEAQKGLLSEEENIRKQILFLEKEISRLEENLRMLLSERFKIERQLQLKLDNLLIDEKCLKIRSLYPSVRDLSGF